MCRTPKTSRRLLLHILCPLGPGKTPDWGRLGMLQSLGPFGIWGSSVGVSLDRGTFGMLCNKYVAP